MNYNNIYKFNRSTITRAVRNLFDFFFLYTFKVHVHYYLLRIELRRSTHPICFTYGTAGTLFSTFGMYFESKYSRQNFSRSNFSKSIGRSLSGNSEGVLIIARCTASLFSSVLRLGRKL